MSEQAGSIAAHPAPPPQVEELESRVVPSAVYAGGQTPGLVRHAYGFDRIGFNGVPGDGRGQTIAVVTANDDPGIAADLAVFDRAFGLPAAPSFRKSQLPGARAVDPSWSLETALDVEWAHAAAPGAGLLLVEAASGDLGDLIAAADYARQQPGVSVVSLSWGSAEFSVESFFDATLTTPAHHAGVAFVAASGDGGAAGALWPALSPNVLAVGGTQLLIDGGGNYLAETAWGGSAGGASRYETAPAAQRVITGSARRLGPDVSYNASFTTTYAIYTSVAINGQVGWLSAGGTSAGAPQWAGLVAVADQGRALLGKSPLTDVVSAVYGLPASAFHDVTSGNNGLLRAGPGYDTLTGRGSPYADRVVSGLVGGAVPTPPLPPPAPPPANKGVDLTFIARRVAAFLKRMTGSGSPQAAPAARPAVRLPSGRAKFLGSAPWDTGA